jgi:putative spermidine/putrescine transport system substrate-binding protein
MGGTNALDTEEGLNKAFEKLAEVKPNVRLWYRDEAQFEQALMSRKVGTAPTLKREVLDLTPEGFAAVSSDIEPIIPRYDLYTTKADWLNQKWTEMIVG